ncbi:hypothetical protein HMI01_26000 [Halolactibacillus miurensis]|uniref:Uncharacterized protein n=1 Tax=Halolactibacillus miurensis TaxID=306541 RepID=A0A1I6UTT6_9BACI|nr:MULTISPECIES: hypothetical protein [Halolactibacillus]GEM05612.1 hypothetical protein HMI01_26000 [Halolactibacillus miurensis]SFT04800.1 hypothetical protein SAMN05421668_13328 [Halolactibacillus miurensis]
MKKRLKKKVIKKLADKNKQYELTGLTYKPTKLENRIVESIFNSELREFHTEERDSKYPYDNKFHIRFYVKLKEIDNMFKSENLLELAKKI